MSSSTKRVSRAAADSGSAVGENVRACRVCGCTDDDCTGCVERTGEPCEWVEDDLCSACLGDGGGRRA